MEVGLSICALGLVLLGDLVPSLLSGGAVGESHFSGVRKSLREEVAGDGVFILPLHNGSRLLPGRFGRVYGLGIPVDASKISPPARHLHGAAEAHPEDGPVGPIGLEARDVCREFLDGRRGGGRRR